MQNPLETRTPLAGRLDRLGLYLVVPLLCCAYFYAVFRRIAAALPAGLALSVLVLMTIHMGEKRSLKGREEALRRRIGGEMAIESLLVQSPESATSNVIGWLCQVLALDQFEPVDNGTIAHHEMGSIFISCLQKHPSGIATVDDVLCAIRNARQHSVDIVIVCATCDFSPQAEQVAEEATPRTRLLGRSGLISMAGVAAPASDEQLRALGKRRRQKFRHEIWKTRILDPAKKRRYLLYGVGLSLLYLASRQVIYVIPALVCLLLFGLCRRKKAGRFTL